MTLQQLINKLLLVAAEGHGDRKVFYRHGASGDCGEVGNAHVTDRIDECGPFDLDEGEKYVSLYVGN
ncbi:MAG: hypothetical protein EOQ39_18605 [Mesorhizobium sp.]|uniref:hypothetical protein n=1 Tax=Mesorhizobium sp. TaxID=1871066 RepID=UPI000FEA6519|nr:hypothetical protein [Mesorhizobium sp.]RWB08818.1 MAG: hypothetical protein EOQ37_04740 [Mesorhizobium sp.]RWB13532.1 MAG: hypothetical protein EOQ39_18605 [Mesorhizobium sp.]